MRRVAWVLSFGLGLVACGSSRAGRRATSAPGVASAPGDAGSADARGGRRAEDLSPVLERIRARHALPALAAAVYDSGGALAEGAVGVRALGQDAGVTTLDRWHLGSDTKAMTATLVARLVERGVVRWETTLAQAFPDLASGMHPAYRAVTLEQLLQHRGGVASDLLAHRALWRTLWQSPLPRTELRLWFVRELLALAPETAPGTFRYANAGYMVVGSALEKATGRPWETLLREEVFGPLGMASCGFGPPAHQGSLDAPWGHRSIPDASVPVPPGPGADNPPALGPAGTVHCALGDWARFATLHLRGARGEASSYLTRESFARMHTPPSGGEYALGWGAAVRPWAGSLPALTHRGSNSMFLATVWLAPSRDRAFLVATNVGGEAASAATEAALAALIASWAPREAP